MPASSTPWGVLSADRLPCLDAPTAAEQGLDVTLAPTTSSTSMLWSFDVVDDV